MHISKLIIGTEMCVMLIPPPPPPMSFSVLGYMHNTLSVLRNDLVFFLKQKPLLVLTYQDLRMRSDME